MPVFLNCGYIESEHPNEGPQDINFTNTRNNVFYIHLKIIDDEHHKIELWQH
jgi:hypothetical protein